MVKLQITISDLSMIPIPFPRIPILADVLRESSSFHQFSNVLNPHLFFPEVKFTVVFMQKKKDGGGEFSALRAFVKSRISNQPRGEESLYTMYFNLT